MKKNCYNCKHGYWDSDFSEIDNITYNYFVCEKRADEMDMVGSRFEQNLERGSYREKAKRCCDLIESREYFNKCLLPQLPTRK